MNVVDSSVWLEYFGDGPNAADFAGVIEAADDRVGAHFEKCEGVEYRRKH